MCWVEVLVLKYLGERLSPAAARRHAPRWKRYRGNTAVKQKHQVLGNVTVVTEQPQPGNSSILADVTLLI